MMLKPLASLRLTVALLGMSMVVILAGTLAQVDAGIWDVQKAYFHSWFCWIPFGLVLPRLKSGGYAIPGALPFAGGFTLIIALLANLLAAHVVRFKLRWNRSGIILAHLGLILLLVGELLTASFATEGQMNLAPGQSLSFAQDIRNVELAIVDPSPADHDNVTVIPASLLSDGSTLHDAHLPFDVHVDAYYVNSQPLGPMQKGPAPDARVNAGLMVGRRVEALPRLSGVGDEAESVDLPAAIVTFNREGKSLGTYMAALWLGQPQDVKTPDGKSYQIELRFKRAYKPYTIQLLKFSHDTYLGTQLDKNFSSRVRLIDPSHHVDREALIWMNHPLRYGFDTLYQQSFGQDRTTGRDTGATTLQVVRNRASLLPYLALGIAIVGLVIQFGRHLIQFTSRLASGPAPLPRGFARDDVERHPAAIPAWALFGPGAVAALVALVGLLVAFAAQPAAPATGFNIDGFGKLPVNYEGRVMPLETLARLSLKIIHGTETFRDNGSVIAPTAWLLEVFSNETASDKREIFKIDNPDVVASIGLEQRRKFFSFDELMAHKEKLQPQMDAVFNNSKADRSGEDLVSSQFRELGERVMLYIKLKQLVSLYLVPPLNKGQDWQTLGEAAQALQTTGVGRDGLRQIITLTDEYAKNQPGEFNATLTDYQALLKASPVPIPRVEFESNFDRVDPFYISIILYVLIAILALCSWLVWHKPLTALAFSLLVAAFVVHSFGLVSRIYISGRPPVTNLYSAAVFIAWAIVAFCLVLELIFRNATATFVGALLGFTSLLMAQGLGGNEDTMGQLRAVLDTNFWLATHVVVVTLGYASTFLAGTLAAVYILKGFATTTLDDESRQSLKNMVYGIVCFGLLFSFVGTILGGIWADQSWGRFWGWDPKENGAVLIVLWNAIVLHARWGGMVRERGLMSLAVFGNVVTSWSYFGTNLLGVGLHSYGFMHGAWPKLWGFWALQLAIITVSLIPLHFWRSFDNPRGFAPKAVRRIPVPA